jgi:hypothetical protein
LIAKRNQRSRHADIACLFSQRHDDWLPQLKTTIVGCGHGRIEVRTLRAGRELDLPKPAR